MKKVLTTMPLLLLPLCLSGCSRVGDKDASLSIIYAATVALALTVLVCYCRQIRDKNCWFVLLFSSVPVVNAGYFWMSVSASLEQALMANRVAYLGSVLLPLSMLMIILNVTNTRYGKWLPRILFAIAAVVFFVVASPGILDIYYREVSFEIRNGVSTLVKVYGPLHPMYLFYLLGYFGAMVAVIIRASAKRQMDSTAHAVVLAIAVFVNIGVWFIEQLSRIDFEMLSVSYIISELFLLGAHLMERETRRLQKLVMDAQAMPEIPAAAAAPAAAAPDRHELFISGLQELTQTEKIIYEAYIAHVTTKEIMATLNIKENTLKFHNKNLYSKLGVSSRKELVEIYRQLKAIGECGESQTHAVR